MINRSMLPPTTPLEFGPIVDLLRLMADPSGTEKRMLELAQRIVEVRAATNAAEREQSVLAVARETHDTKIRGERTAHENRLASASLNFEKACRERERELTTRETAVADREREVTASAKAASELKADLEQRLARLRSIAS
jgi:hypothetical protein